MSSWERMEPPERNRAPADGVPVKDTVDALDEYRSVENELRDQYKRNGVSVSAAELAGDVEWELLRRRCHAQRREAYPDFSGPEDPPEMWRTVSRPANVAAERLLAREYFDKRGLAMEALRLTSGPTSSWKLERG